LEEISKAYKCTLQALTVQTPFHVYEEDVLAMVEPCMPQVMNGYTERKGSARDGVSRQSARVWEEHRNRGHYSTRYLL